jgi:hypothetical protein
MIVRCWASCRSWPSVVSRKIIVVADIGLIERCDLCK